MHEQSTARRLGRTLAVLGALCALGLLATAATASATALRWSPARSIDTSIAQSLNQVRCPSASLCTALDANGRAIAYDPSTRRAGAPVQIAQGQPVFGAACPTATQCTVVTPSDRAYTYNPRSARQAKPQTLEATSSQDDNSIQAVSCPSTGLCVAADSAGNVIAFAPGASAAPVVTSLGSGEWNAIACPTSTQCTVAGQNVEATFKPAAPGGAARVRIAPVLDDILDVSCPTATQCTALDGAGGEETFDPQMPPVTLPARVVVADSNVVAMTCPAATQCTTVSQSGRQSTFDPSVATPTVKTVQIDTSQVGGGPGQDEGLGSVSCPSTSACVAVDAVGKAINFNPAASITPPGIKIDAGTPLVGISCPTTRQCTAMGPFRQATFNPLNKGKPPTRGMVVTDHFFQAGGISCASTTQCLAAVTTHQATFNPRRFRRPKLRQLAAFDDGAVAGLSCLSTRQCVATDTDGYAITYNPKTAKFIRRRIKVEPGEALTGSACSSRTQCTAIDNDGQAITFQPLTAKKIASAKIDASVGLDAPSGDSDNELDAISCPGARRCVAVDTRGAAVSFNPRSAHSVKPTMIDPGHDLTSVSCPTTKRCVAVDAAGQVLAGGVKPATWKTTPVLGASGLTGVDCPSSKECVAVDATGDAFVGKG